MKSHMSIIVLVGLAGAGMMAVAMLVTMNDFAEGPAGERVRIALEIARTFSFDRVTPDPAAPPTELWFSYEFKEALKGGTVDYEMELEARRILDLGKQEEALNPDSAKQRFQELRDRYAFTGAAKELQMWEVARFAWKAYANQDKRALQRVKVTRRALRGRAGVDTLNYTFEIPQPVRR